ncbi:hypothetical protein [Desulfurobacterium sp.]
MTQINQEMIENIKKKAKKHLEGFGFKNDDINELTEDGINSIKSKLFLIEKALKKRDIKTLIRLTHALKGILLNLGMEKQAEEFRKVKRLYEDNNSFENIEAQVRKAISKLKE